MKKKMILVTGAAGMVGNAIKEIFNDEQLILTDKDTLDVRSHQDAFAYAREDLKLIIHLAAETDLEICQNEPVRAYQTNHYGCFNIIHLARYLNIPIVYIGTAGIFDGKNHNKGYSEYDEANPSNCLNNYGKSKLLGETIVRGYQKHYIFRASWMMGGGPQIDKKFVNKIFRQIKTGAKEIYGIQNIIGSPTYTIDLAKTIKTVLINKAPFGLYHCAGEGVGSRYEVAKSIVDYLGVDIKVIPVKDDYFKNDFSCPRSKNEVLRNDKLNILGFSKMRDWRIALKEYIEKDFKPCLLQ